MLARPRLRAPEAHPREAAVGDAVAVQVAVGAEAATQRQSRGARIPPSPRGVYPVISGEMS